MLLPTHCIQYYLVGVRYMHDLILGNPDRPGVYFGQWLREYWLFGVLVKHLLNALIKGIFPTMVSVRPFIENISEK